MTKTSTWRRRIPMLLLAAMAASPLFGQQPAAPNAEPKKSLLFRTGRTRDGVIGIAQLNDVMIVCWPTVNKDDPGGDVPVEGDPPRPAARVTFNQGNLDQLVFGKVLDAAGARQRLAMTLHWKIDAIDRACELSDSQIEKLRLAGRGDIKHLIDRATGIRARFENMDGIRDVEQFRKWSEALATETDAVRPLLTNGPFDANSLFAKALKRTLTAEQTADIARSPHGLVFGLAGGRAPLSLDDILGEWERAAARRGRLDCDFTRFRYESTLRIERRGEGSLAVDRSGRAAYRIGPADIPAQPVGALRAPVGRPFQLKAEAPERWYWTGTSLVRANETTRTFEEWKLPSRTANGEDQPEPPGLPGDARAGNAPLLREGFRGRTDTASTAGRPSTPPEPMTGLLAQIMLSQSLSKIEFATLIERLQDFDRARSFLLGVPANDLRQRFDVKLVKRTEEEIWLQFAPRRIDDQASLHDATLILDAAGYLPKALKEIDPTGVETVHVYKNVSVARTKDGTRFALPAGKEPLDRPNLAGYSKAPR